MSTCCFGQYEYYNSFGIKAGTHGVASYQNFLSENFAIEYSVGRMIGNRLIISSIRNTQISVTGAWYTEFPSPYFRWYTGAGFLINLFSFSDNIIGAVGLAGIDWQLPGIPMLFRLEYAPQVYFDAGDFPTTDIHQVILLGVHWML